MLYYKCIKEVHDTVKCMFYYKKNYNMMYYKLY